MKNPKGKRWIRTSLPLGIGERVGTTDDGKAVYMFVKARYTGPIDDKYIEAESDIRTDVLRTPRTKKKDVRN